MVLDVLAGKDLAKTAGPDAPADVVVPAHSDFHEGLDFFSVLWAMILLISGRSGGGALCWDLVSGDYNVKC